MKCPLCDGEYCQSLADSQTDSIMLTCVTYKRSFKIGESICAVKDAQLKNRIDNLIFEHVMRRSYADDHKTYWRFFYEPAYRISEKDESNQVNVAEILPPKDLSERIDRILLNLYRIDPNYGYRYIIDHKLFRAFFIEAEEEEDTLGIITLMNELGYLIQQGQNYIFKISAKGWQRIEELLRQDETEKKAFIAMAFNSETESIRKAFKAGIKGAGYLPMAIDEKEHNNQIVPEIFYEIDKSKFLVMDVTVPNYGAYYEAGYALGKGKQVIICCRKDAFEDPNKVRPHFDIAQKSMILWEDYEELTNKLKNRIKATVK